MTTLTKASHFDTTLRETFNHSNISELTSYEKQRAYELLKAQIPEDATAKEYESEIQRITDYLEI